MKRTTYTQLLSAVRLLNEATGNGSSFMAKNPAPGTFVLQGAYGGWQLQRIMDEYGSVTSVTTGYRTKREVLQQVDSIRYGVLLGLAHTTGATV